jgi:RNA polymerase sigma-70 factor (ECF subfamily)
MTDGFRNGAGRADGSSTSTSTSLLERAKANDTQAWQRLVKLYGPTVYGWALRAHLSPEDAEDVGQEVFVAVSRNLAQFHRDRPGDSFRGWLWTITNRKICDFKRKGRCRISAAGGTAVQEQLAQLPEPESSDAPPAPASGELQGLYGRAMALIQAEFEERTWKAFLRVTVEHQPPADVAAELGMSLGAVYIAKSRVLKRLREEFRDLFVEEAPYGLTPLPNP